MKRKEGVFYYYLRSWAKEEKCLLAYIRDKKLYLCTRHKCQHFTAMAICVVLYFKTELSMKAIYAFSSRFGLFTFPFNIQLVVMWLLFPYWGQINGVRLTPPCHGPHSGAVKETCHLIILYVLVRILSFFITIDYNFCRKWRFPPDKI